MPLVQWDELHSKNALRKDILASNTIWLAIQTLRLALGDDVGDHLVELMQKETDADVR